MRLPAVDTQLPQEPLLHKDSVALFQLTPLLYPFVLRHWFAPRSAAL